ILCSCSFSKSKRKYGYIRDLVSSDILVKNACNIRVRLKSNDPFIVFGCWNRPASHIRSSINEDPALLQDYRVPVRFVHLASAKGQELVFVTVHDSTVAKITVIEEWEVNQ